MLATWIMKIPNSQIHIHTLVFSFPVFRIVDGVLKTNVAFPGLKVEYSIDCGKTWFDTKGANVTSGKLLLRTR